MTFSITEVKAKIARIKELSTAGLNTPRMFFIKHNVNDFDFDLVIKWAKEIHDKDPNQIFNIRTYSRNGHMETLNTPHYTDIKYEDLFKTLVKANMKYHCMIDSETPDNGRLAGNGIIFTDNFSSPNKILIEYCKKEKRAMVRDNLDHTFEQSLKDDKRLIKTIIEIEPKLIEVLNGLKKFPKKDVILEWTYFCNPSGVLGKNVVWWEFRSWK